MIGFRIGVGARMAGANVPDPQKTQSRRLPWYGWVGLSTLLAGELGLILKIFPVQVLFYCIAWWSYIALADAWVWKRRGDSLLRNRPWEFFVLAFWSIAVWNPLEVSNFCRCASRSEKL